MTNNPFSAERVAQDAFELFCEGVCVDIKQLTIHVPDTVTNLTVGAEIEAKLVANVVDTSSGVGAQKSIESLVLPLVVTGQSQTTGEYLFRVVQRVVRFRFIGEDFSVCWGTLNFSGPRVWFSGDCMCRQDWTEYDLTADDRKVVPMVFEDADKVQAVHPELAHAA